MTLMYHGIGRCIYTIYYYIIYSSKMEEKASIQNWKILPFTKDGTPPTMKGREG